jgi:hypothetical protein
MRDGRLPATAAAGLLMLAGCGGGDATLATFGGTWQGHGHTLKITRAGVATETIDSGCCHLALAVDFRLSNPHGTARTATATATVAAVRTGEQSAFAEAIPKPRVGQSRTIRLREGVITETLTGTRYCSPAAKRWVCGA